MLPDNFDFAQLPDKEGFTLEEIGMLASRIEDIDYPRTQAPPRPPQQPMAR